MNAAPEQPKRRGRPPKPADQLRSERAELRMTPAERQKFDALGGPQWFLQALQRAKLPT